MMNEMNVTARMQDRFLFYAVWPHRLHGRDEHTIAISLLSMRLRNGNFLRQMYLLRNFAGEVVIMKDLPMRANLVVHMM